MAVKENNWIEMQSVSGYNTFLLLSIDKINVDLLDQQVEASKSVAIIGTGDMGRVLTSWFSKAGYHVVTGSRDPLNVL